MNKEEAVIEEIMETHCDALKKADFQVLLSLYSKDWKDYHGATKDSLEYRYKQPKEEAKGKGMSLFETIQDIDTSAANVTIKGNRAVFSPVIHSSSGGS